MNFQYSAKQFIELVEKPKFRPNRNSFVTTVTTVQSLRTLG